MAGALYGTATNLDGRYTLVNLRTGGPYTVTISFIGFQTASGNWAALDAFIESEPSLRDNRGEVARRNSARAPWVNFLDFNVTQEVATIQGQQLEVTATLLNVLNLLGVRYTF